MKKFFSFESYERPYRQKVLCSFNLKRGEQRFRHSPRVEKGGGLPTSVSCNDHTREKFSGYEKKRNVGGGQSFPLRRESDNDSAY